MGLFHVGSKRKGVLDVGAGGARRQRVGGEGGFDLSAALKVRADDPVGGLGYGFDCYVTDVGVVADLKVFEHVMGLFGGSDDGGVGEERGVVEDEIPRSPFFGEGIDDPFVGQGGDVA